MSNSMICKLVESCDIMYLAIYEIMTMSSIASIIFSSVPLIELEIFYIYLIEAFFIVTIIARFFE